MYVFENDQGEIKIGWAVKPAARLETIRAGNPHSVWLAYERDTLLPIARKVEMSAHKFFRDHRIGGVGKEWFAVPAKVAAAKIDALVRATRLRSCRIGKNDFRQNLGPTRTLPIRVSSAIHEILLDEAKWRDRSIHNLLRIIVSDWIAGGVSLSVDRVGSRPADMPIPTLPEPEDGRRP